jgi:hypothetical protein
MMGTLSVQKGLEVLNIPILCWRLISVEAGGAGTPVRENSPWSRHEKSLLFRAMVERETAAGE